MMHKTLAEELADRKGRNGFRVNFLTSDFCKTTTTEDVLDNPERVWKILTTSRNVGQVSIARLRQFLSQKFADRCPQEWEAAKDALAQGTVPSDARTHLLARYMTAWNVDPETIELTGRFLSLDALKVEHLLDAARQGQKAIHVSGTLPMETKTRAMLRSDARRRPGEAHLAAKFQANFAKAPDLRVQGVTLLDTHTLKDLRDGRGHFEDLTKTERQEQFQALREFAVKNQPHRDVIVTDLAANRLSSAFLMGRGPLMCYVFDGYLEIVAPDLISVFRERVAEACADGLPLIDWVETNCGGTGGMGQTGEETLTPTTQGSSASGAKHQAAHAPPSA